MSSTTLLASKDHDYKYYELLVNNSIPVLRRSKDGHVNGSQILQLVGLSAQKRRSLLLQFEKNVAKFGCFELVKIGPRRYQGFWYAWEILPLIEFGFWLSELLRISQARVHVDD